MWVDFWNRWQPSEEHQRVTVEVARMRERAERAMKARQERLQAQYDLRGRGPQR